MPTYDHPAARSAQVARDTLVELRIGGLIRFAPGRVYNPGMRALARLVLLPMLGGCSLIYNESNIPQGTVDAAEPDAEIIVDADPSMMDITGVNPAEIKEGQGVGGSRKALIVVDGQHMVKGNLMVMVTPSAGAAKTPMIMVDMSTLDVDANGRRLAFEIMVPVDSRATVGLTTGDVIPLDITVMQTNPIITRQLLGMLKVRGLPELTNANLPAAGLPAFTEYSSVVLTAGTVKGVANLAEPVIVRSTSSISMTGVTTTVSAVDQTGGPGAGNGGTGGAGLGNPGAPGTGPAPGAPSGGIGRYEGDEQLKSHRVADKNRGSGGAGGDGAVLTTGGNGGGGGGSIELTADGDVTVGTITAVGAAPTTTGGGGSGGVILVRAGNDLNAGTLDVSGAGQPGRARYDAAGTATVANAGAVFRGPMFVNPPRITNEQKPMITVVGQPSKAFQYYFAGSSGVDESVLFQQDLLASGMKTFPLAGPLFPGLNKLCLVVAGGDKSSETRNCIDIALLYKPPT